jgi:hypothetical protein
MTNFPNREAFKSQTAQIKPQSPLELPSGIQLPSCPPRVQPLTSHFWLKSKDPASVGMPLQGHWMHHIKPGPGTDPETAKQDTCTKFNGMFDQDPNPR